MIADLSIDDLSQRCAAETENYNRRQPSDDTFCFELLRRALADGASEAFTRAYQVYERRVMGWVLVHSRFVQTGESADYFASAAWSTFFFALRGPKFAGFGSLPQVLRYLKLCVHTSIAQYIRDQQPGLTTPIVKVPPIALHPELGEHVNAAAIWERIEQLLPDDLDRLLARCVMREDLKPRQIVAAYPGRWRDEREVSVDTYRIRRLLRKDAELARLLGLRPED